MGGDIMIFYIYDLGAGAPYFADSQRVGGYDIFKELAEAESYLSEIKRFDEMDHYEGDYEIRVKEQLSTYRIEDWGGNHLFIDREFMDFEEAEEFLSQYFYDNEIDYEEGRQEYEIVEVI